MDKQSENMLQELLDLNDGLTDWEIDFLESLAVHVGELTDRQRGKLDEIYRGLI